MRGPRKKQRNYLQPVEPLTIGTDNTEEEAEESDEEEQGG